MLEDVFRVIDENRDTSIERLQALCRQPSIGATGEGMEELLDGVLSYLPDRTSTETQAEEVEDEADEPDWSPI